MVPVVRGLFSNLAESRQFYEQKVPARICLVYHVFIEQNDKADGREPSAFYSLAVLSSQTYVQCESRWMNLQALSTTPSLS
jgi:hypothetical protein